MSHIGLCIRDGDIVIDPIQGLKLVKDNEAIGQHVAQRLQSFAGDWFLDRQSGIDWFENVLGNQYDPDLVEAIVKVEIIETHGVNAITSFNLRFDPRTRQMTGFNIVVLTIEDTQQEVIA